MDMQSHSTLTPLMDVTDGATAGAPKLAVLVSSLTPAGPTAPTGGTGKPTERKRAPGAYEHTARARIFEPWLAAMGLLAPVVPVPAIVVTIVIHYVVERNNALGDGTLTPILSSLIGVFCLLVLWAAVAVAWIPHTRRENANPNLYGRLVTWQKQFTPKCDDYALAEQTERSKVEACQEVRSVLQEFEDEFEEDGNRWATQAGYLTLLRSRHRAEEARIGYAPVEEVAAEAWEARLRLLDSKMDAKTRDELQRGLEISIWKLGPSAWPYLPDNVREELNEASVRLERELKANARMEGWLAATSREELDVRKSGAAVKSEEGWARNFVRMALYDINSYEDERNDRLLDMRSDLVTAAGWVGGLSYLLVVLGIVLWPSNTPATWPDLLLGAGVLYLVGAAAGLMYRLYVESRSQFAVEDYGLSMMRIVTTPVLSGLAGAVGAVLMSVVLGTGAPPGVFNLAEQPYGLIYAAVFGLTPNVLVNYLQKQAKTYISEIESVKAPAAASGGGQSKGSV